MDDAKRSIAFVTGILRNRSFFQDSPALRTRLSQKLPMQHSLCKMHLYQLPVTQLVCMKQREWTLASESEHNVGTLHLLPLLFFVLDLLSSNTPPSPPPTVFLLRLKMTFALPGPLCLHGNFRISLSVSTEKPAAIWTGIVGNGANYCFYIRLFKEHF